jgi:hypothetical protein
MSSQEQLIDRLLRQLLATAHRQLVDGPALSPVSIAADLHTAHGSIHSSPVILTSQRFCGGAWESLTLASIATAQQQLCSLTVIGIPAATTAWPILGIDLIAIRGALSLVAVDLAPTDLPLWEAQAAGVLRTLHSQVAGSVVLRKRPQFTDGAFSELALIAGARPAAEPTIAVAIDQFLHSTADLLAQPLGQPPPPAAAARRSGWLAAERRNRKEHNALANIFGPDFARRYLDEFLFADTRSP